ncbi:MAG: flagellar basal body L-ring protein FlgH [Vampirovibrio sp.]|nr:flagellar basal body L-ring protein FlgH [Vampirovibrio sp.]
MTIFYHPQKMLHRTAAASLLLAISIASFQGVGFCESLFRAGVSHSVNTPSTPRSLYTQPRPEHVGDIITIQLNETGQQQINGDLTLNRNQTVEDNQTSRVNDIIHSWGVPNFINFPTFDGVVKNNNTTSRVQSLRNTILSDNITCQVIQVLPNGYLMVQGHKTIAMNKERQDMFVTGIVNPFYLNRNNQIASNQVGNLQVMIGGKGVLSRQQGDGMINKLYQLYY